MERKIVGRVGDLDGWSIGLEVDVGVIMMCLGDRGAVWFKEGVVGS